jgi:hypothetical protein
MNAADAPNLDGIERGQKLNPKWSFPRAPRSHPYGHIQMPVIATDTRATRQIKADLELKATPVIAVGWFAMKGDEASLAPPAAITM